MPDLILLVATLVSFAVSILAPGLIDGHLAAR
jgi:hypothetical protein